MAFEFHSPYNGRTEERIRKVYHSLSEKDRRRYAAIEAEKLGHGGITYIAGLLDCSEHTIRRGLGELDHLEHDPAGDQQRLPGGGRKPKIEQEPEIEDNLYSVLDVHLGGHPDDPEIVWTHLSPEAIAERVTELGTPVSGPTIADWLHDHNLRRRKIKKSIPGGHTPDRDEQFVYIDSLRQGFRAAGNPIFSIDTKAKEHLGTMFRDGRACSSAPFQAFDHDYPSWSDGVLIPHGIYDPVRNHGHLNLGTSHDTSEFACDSFRWFWQRIGRYHYPRATKILWLCDGGGSNSCRHWIFKQDLGRLATAIGLPIRVAHYPAYCSKYNPIERRFFSQVTRTCSGVLLKSISFAMEQMRKTATSTGLSTTVHWIKREYETKRKATVEFMQNMPIKFDNILPLWNYTATAR